MRRSVVLLLLSSGMAVASGCRRGPPAPSPAPEVAEVEIETGAGAFVLGVEIATTPRQIRAGLSRRPALPEDRGMLFLFPAEQPRGSAFWMYRTAVPLSIALLDADRVIREIQHMEPCRSPISLFCRRYRAGVPFHAALEVGRGYFERRGIGVGDRVKVRGRTGAVPPRSVPRQRPPV